MATQKILMVAGDFLPDLLLSLTDERTGQPMDISVPNTQIAVKFREIGAEYVNLYGYATPIAGRINPDTGDIDTQPPWDIAGRGGRCRMQWWYVGSLRAGEYEVEVVVSLPDGQMQTAYNLLRLSVRERFA